MHKVTAGYRHHTQWLATIILWFAAVLTCVVWQGRKGKVMLPLPVNATVASPEQATAIWEEKGVRGRILLLFDDYPHMRGLAFYDGIPQLSKGNFVEYAIFRNIVRKIYYVVGDDSWDSFAQRKDIGVFRAVANNYKGLYLFTMSGVPLIAVPASFLPQIDEKVLVYVNNSVTPYDQVRSLLDRKRIDSDMLLTYRGGKP